MKKEGQYIPRFLWGKVGDELRQLFWVFLVSCVLTCISLDFLRGIMDFFVPISLSNEPFQLSFPWFISNSIAVYFFVLTLIVLLLIFFTQNPAELFQKQHIHEEPSWVYYIYFGLIFSSLSISAILFFEVDTFFFPVFDSLKSYWWLGIVFVPLLSGYKKVAIKNFNEEKLSPRMFSPDSIDINHDSLGFGEKAKGYAKGISEVNDYVNVFLLVGRPGEGKSSFARMIIEDLDKRKTLYTYISLTETNEAKDFAALFAERFRETLSYRYPKVDISSCLPSMKSILRNTNGGIISDLLESISFLNIGLLKTHGTCSDEHYFCSSDRPALFSVSNNVAKIFGNVPEIKEDIWVIQIDEIERGQFDEIYRTVEIIERFKYEGRSGLPVRLVFMLLISQPDFDEYLSKYEKENSSSFLLKNFFEDVKTPDYTLGLPPVSQKSKREFLDSLLKQVYKRHEIEDFEVINFPEYILYNFEFRFYGPEESGREIVNMLSHETPRMIKRIVNSVNFLLASISIPKGFRETLFFDYLALQYIEKKYPFLLIFFQCTIDFLLPIDSWESSFQRREEKEKYGKNNLIGWINDVTGKNISEEGEKKEILNLVGLVMYYYFDFLRGNYEKDFIYQYYGRTSYPEEMRRYLQLTLKEEDKTDYYKNNELYLGHQKSSAFLKALTNTELLSYSHFINGISISKPKVHADVTSIIKERIFSEEIFPQHNTPEDTILNDAVYEIIFNILEITEKSGDSDYDDSINSAFKDLRGLLLWDGLGTGLKFKILSSFVNSERGDGASIHTRLTQAFGVLSNKFGEDNLKNIIKNVFDEYERRYINGGDILYEHEENFFFTLYQGWSGKINMPEIEKIREVAKRGITEHPDVIELYWSKFPFKDGWTNLNDVKKDDRFFSFDSMTRSVYMPLEDLINVTKKVKDIDKKIIKKMRFWETLMRESEVVASLTIKEDASTLKSFLLRNNYLDDEI